jgi:hypothetical protein
MRESKMAGGDALSAFGRESVPNATEGGNHLPWSQQTGLGAEKRLDRTVRKDIMSVNETKCRATVAGAGHMGNVGLKDRFRA